MTSTPLSAALTSAQEDQFRPSAQGSAAARVYSGLRAQIISLELEPHSNLVRTEIAQNYGVSQSPIREAMHRLEQEGLVVSYPQSRTVVARIDVDHARETQFLRMAIELEVARSLTKLGQPDTLRTARRILAIQKMAGDDRDIDEFTALDRLFHLSLMEPVGVVSLYHLVSSRSGHIDRLRRLNLPDPGKMASVLQHHTEILDAIEAGDLAKTEDAVRRHLGGTLAAAPQIMEQYPHYF
ncbi:GntR family transcriptional regulator [Hoeflea sp. YIM 152468]|uniref:GntR family transcriptional regulator n=1 Tax=Hoeflea sp. YIM 152468 TaxID=3031759 RepID=UPI0023DC94C9|nr:GntR family transcriptional regulator [Hoeflea sp. YIM 152468]MDF1606676.1 GntR family transcriptional regulator [Hoeflea sp. YIM 152468]